MIQTPGYSSSAALAPGGASSNYIASAAHYEFLARRILAALRDSSRPLVLVTGNPPPNPEALSQALGTVARPGYAVTITPCGPELAGADLERSVPTAANSKATPSAAPEPGSSASASPLFLLVDVDRLSDRQIEEIYKGTLHAGQVRRAAVLLATADFYVRLERPALHFLKERIAAQFRFQEVGDDEAIAVLHNQLFSQRDRRLEARVFRHGVLVGLCAGGAVIAAGIGAFVLHPTAEQVCEASKSTGRGGSVSEQASVFQPKGEAATKLEQAGPKTETMLATSNPQPLPPPKVENKAAVAPPGMVQPPAGSSPSAVEISGLLARGDAFLSAGDITSARLFYERAANAESGLAALQLGGTFDPMILGRSGVRGIAADPAQALSWYRRARELGAGEAEQRIKALEIWSGD